MLTSDVRDRAHAALLGSAIGDALGATLEFLTPSEVRSEYGVLRDIRGGGWLSLRPGAVTDDTEMALCVARSLAEGRFSARDIADRFVVWLRSRPKDVGNTCRRGIRRYMHDGSLEGLSNEGDAGNGAVMRMAPVAVATLGDSKLLAQWAVSQAHITHNHPLSDAACVLVGTLIHKGCLGAARDDLLHDAEESPFRLSSYRGMSSAYVVDTMETVLHYLFATESFEDCLIATVNRGGDADTTGAIAGAIAGALYGSAEIPKRWTKKLDRPVFDEVASLAERLVEGSPLGRDGGPLFAQRENEVEGAPHGCGYDAA